MVSCGLKKKKKKKKDQSIMADSDDRKTDATGSRASTTTYKSAPLLLLASGMGTFLEFYSFGLIGYFESEVADAFFPSSDSSYISMLESFSLYGVAFVVRPFGGMFFGYIADKYSRITSLRASILCMALPTFLIGCTPTFEMIGYASTVTVFILRMLQGLSAGGEITTAMVYIAEKCNEARYMRQIQARNSAMNLNNASQSNENTSGSETSQSTMDSIMSLFENPNGTNAALYLGSLWIFGMGDFVALLFHDILEATMDDNDLYNWGWRIPFWLSIFISIFAVYVRAMLDESEEFENVDKEELETTTPVTDVFKYYLLEVIFLAFILVGPGVNYYVVLTWVPVYLQSDIHYGSDDNIAYYVDALSYVVVALNLLFFGYLADRKGHWKTAHHTCIVAMIACVVLFWILGVTDNVVVLSFAQV